jgi:hypothetical protein
MCATESLNSMTHISLCAIEFQQFCGAFFYASQKYICGAHVFKCVKNPFLSISVFLVGMMSSTTSHLSRTVPSPTISRYARLPPPTLFPILFHTFYLVLPNLVE